MSDYLPQEVVVEILLRLPSKSLVQFTCVSKSWYSLISSPAFISMYTEFQRNKKNMELFVRYYCRLHGKEVFVHYSDDDHDADNNMLIDNYRTFHCPFRSKYKHLLGFVGSCNGLVCLIDIDTDVLYLWNPSLGLSKVLPYRKGFTFAYGIGFDAVNFDYKVVKIRIYSCKVFDVDVFSLREDSWRSIGDQIALPTYSFKESKQVFLNGNIFWIGFYHTDNLPKRIVAVFNVANEIFGELELPSEIAFGKNNLSLSVHGQSLSLISHDDLVESLQEDSHWGIWVIKEYEQPWTKLYTICPSSSFSRTLGFRRNGQILLMTTNGDPITFDPQSKKVYRLKMYGILNSFNADTYTESLVLWKAFDRIMRLASSSNSGSQSIP